MEARKRTYSLIGGLDVCVRVAAAGMEEARRAGLAERYYLDEAAQRAATLSLFPEDREIPADALDGVQVKLQEMELRGPRAFGNYWLGCELWRRLGLDAFWEARLGEGREEVPWAKVLELLVVSRLVSPGSEFRLHRQGFN